MSNRLKNNSKTTLIYVEPELIAMTERRLNHLDFSQCIKLKPKVPIHQERGLGSSLVTDVFLKQQRHKYKSNDEHLLHRLELWIDRCRVQTTPRGGKISDVGNEMMAPPSTPKVRKSQSFKDSKRVNFRTLRNKTFSLASKMGKSLSTNDLSNQNSTVESDITNSDSRTKGFAALPNKGVVPRIVRRCFPLRHSSFIKEKNKQNESERERKCGSLKDTKVKLRPSLSNMDFIPTTYESEGETTRKRRLSKQRPSLSRIDNPRNLNDDSNNTRNNSKILDIDSIKSSTRSLLANQQKSEPRKYTNTFGKSSSVMESGLLGRQFNSAVSLRPCDINRMHAAFGTTEYTFIDIV